LLEAESGIVKITCSDWQKPAEILLFKKQFFSAELVVLGREWS
jgi:hypothetical protein